MTPRILEGALAAQELRVAIAAARYNDFIVSSLLAGALGAWAAHGGRAEALEIVRVPGAYELPVAARKLASVGRYDAIVALGCVIRGDTAQNDVGIGNGCGFARTITGRAGRCAGAFRTNAQAASRVDARDGSATGADGVNVEHGHAYGEGIDACFRG